MLPPLVSAAGQRLQHVNLIARPERIGEAQLVAHRLAIDVNGDVPAQRALIVEHITAQRRVRREHPAERLAHRRGLDLGRGCGEEALQSRGEGNGRHASSRVDNYVDINIIDACQRARTFPAKSPSPYAMHASAFICSALRAWWRGPSTRRSGRS